MTTFLLRLEALEKRVSALEALAPEVPHRRPEEALRTTPLATVPSPQRERPLDAPPTVPPALPPALPPAPPRLGSPLPARVVRPAARPAPPRDLESWFGAVVVGRVGIAAVLLAATYFAQLAYRSVGDVLKVASLYGWSALLIGAGAFLRRRVAPRFVGLLWGGGLSVAYLAALAATLRYELVDPWVGLALCVGAAALGQVMARSLKAQALGTVSLVGALAAPVLLGVVFHSGWFVLAYAALLHGWGAFAERTYGWDASRAAAWIGAVLLGALWSQGHALPGETQRLVALHAFALALLLPDLWVAWRGGDVRPGYAVGTAWGLGLLLLAGARLEWLGEVSSSARGAQRGVTLGAGALWLGLAAWLGPREPAGRRLLLRVLATSGGVALTLGAALVWPHGHLALGVYAALAAVAALHLALRGRLGVGEMAATVATLLAWCVAVVEATWFARFGLRGGEGVPSVGALEALVALALALVPSGLLLVSARRSALRILGAAAGATLLLVVFAAQAIHGGHAWVGWAVVAPLAWSLSVGLWAQRRAALALASAARVLAGLSAAVWVAGALLKGRVPAWPVGLDPHTLAALGTAAGLCLLRRGLPAPTQPRHAGPGRGLLMAGTVGLLLLAGWREARLWSLAEAAHLWPAFEALYLGAAGLLLALHARSGARLGRTATAQALLATAALHTVAFAVTRLDAGALACTLLGVAVLTLTTREVLARGAAPRPSASGLTLVPLLLLVTTWLLAAALRRFPLEMAWFNLRAATGAGLALALSIWTWRDVRAARPPSGALARASRWAGGGAAFAVAFLAGLFELVRSTRDLPGAWGPVVVSGYLTLAAVLLLVAGFRSRLQPLRIAALVGLGCVVVKVGVHDLSATVLPLRVLITGGLGLVLLSSAYAYARRRHAPSLSPSPSSSSSSSSSPEGAPHSEASPY